MASRRTTRDENIAAKLRELTEQTRRLRDELRTMMQPDSSDPTRDKDLTRGTVRVAPWPKERRTQSAPVACERRRTPRDER